MPAPQIYIWGGRIKEDRLTLPRPSGNKFLRHQVDVYPTLAMANDDPNLDTAFPALLDAIMETLRTTPIGIVITDPVTGGTSQLQNVGEEMSVDYATPQALADQAMLLFNGLITVIVDEFVIG